MNNMNCFEKEVLQDKGITDFHKFKFSNRNNLEEPTIQTYLTVAQQTGTHKRIKNAIKHLWWSFLGEKN